jgi:hypothetical protein
MTPFAVVSPMLPRFTGLGSPKARRLTISCWKIQYINDSVSSTVKNTEVDVTSLAAVNYNKLLIKVNEKAEKFLADIMHHHGIAVWEG